MTFHNLRRGIQPAYFTNLLTNQASGGRNKVGIGAPRVNVQPAATGVTGVHAQFLWLAEALDIIEDALDALLVKLVVMAKRHQITQ